MSQEIKTFFEVHTYSHGNEPRATDMDDDVKKYHQSLINAEARAEELCKVRNDTHYIRKHIVRVLKTFKTEICTTEGDKSKECQQENCKKKEYSNSDFCMYHLGINTALTAHFEEYTKQRETTINKARAKKLIPWLGVIANGYGDDRDEAQATISELVESTDLDELCASICEYSGDQPKARHILKMLLGLVI